MSKSQKEFELEMFYNDSEDYLSLIEKALCNREKCKKKLKNILLSKNQKDKLKKDLRRYTGNVIYHAIEYFYHFSREEERLEKKIFKSKKEKQVLKDMKEFNKILEDIVTKFPYDSEYKEVIPLFKKWREKNKRRFVKDEDKIYE